MTAITGIFHRDSRSVDYDQIKKMNDQLSHRGTDGSKVYCERSVALGHQMLYTTPESLNETLPFESDGLVITADARIDNRKELSKKLGIADKENITDSYFILKAYKKWGENCPEELLGDFTFAIWDNTNQKLFCARDHMGVKQFYYYLTDNSFFFATEIKALFTIPEVPCKINEEKVALYLSDINDKKFTFYKEIYTLIAANSITIENDEFRMKSYWKLDPDYHISMDSDDDYFKAFKEIFTEAVNCRLRSAYPLGFELSGGLDSSSVVCVAKNIIKKSIKTFSLINDGFTKADESYYIQKVLDLGGIKPHFSILGDSNLLKNIKKIFWYQDQPFFNPFISRFWDFNKKINENNVRVLLTGHGGDEVLLFDMCYLRELFTSFHWVRLINEINNYSQVYHKNRMKIFINNIIFPLIPVNIKNWGKKWIRQQSSDYSKEINVYILSEKFAEKYGGYEHFKDMYLDYYGAFFNAKTLKEVRYKSIDVITDDVYKGMIDRVNSAFSIESRHPFLDKRLVEFCYGLPSEMIFRFGRDKYILREAMVDILPKKIQWRTNKGEFDEVYYRNFRLYSKDYLQDLIHNNDEFIKDYVNLERLEYLYKRLIKGEMSMDLITLWYVSLVNTWLCETEILPESCRHR